MKVASLPANVHLSPGRLEIVFATPEDLLTYLVELSQAIANDYSVFENRFTLRFTPSCAEEGMVGGTWRAMPAHKKRPPGVGTQAGATPALVRFCRPKAFVLAPDRRWAGRPSLLSDLECFLERKGSAFESQSIEPHRFLTSALAQAGLEACGRGLHPE